MDEATARAVSTIIIAFGGPALLISLGRTIWKWWTGRAGRERVRNNDLVTQKRAAEARADQADVLRRKALEYASILRRQLFDAHIEPEPWPADLGTPPKQRNRSDRSQSPKETP